MPDNNQATVEATPGGLDASRNGCRGRIGQGDCELYGRTSEEIKVVEGGAK
jgi:hypothetical protein